MEKKYRIKLKNGRVIGPFLPEKIAELYINKQLVGSEQCQLFPSGNWMPLSEDKFLKKLIGKIVESKISSEDIKENKKNIHKIISEATKESAESKNSDPQFKEFQFEKEDDSTLEETVIVNIKDIEEKEENKTQTNVTIIEEKKEEEIEQEIVPTPVSADDKTEFFNIKEHLPAIKQETKMLDEDKEIEESTHHEPPAVSNKKDKRRIRPIFIIIVAVVAFASIFFDGGNEQIDEPLYVKIIFPVVREYENPVKSDELFEKGINYYNKGDYINKILAADYFRDSLSHKFDNNPALGLLILSYAELFPNVSDRRTSASNFFKLLQISQNKLLTDPNAAMGAALFYQYTDKVQTATNLLENYLRVASPTLKLLSYYLSILIDKGNLPEAKKTLSRLEKMDNLPLEAYLAMIKYHDLNEDRKKKDELVNIALEVYPESYELLLIKSRMSLEVQDLSTALTVIKKLEEIKCAGAPTCYSQYLEFLGILSAASGDNEKAANYFKKSLSIKESDSLRSKLAALQVGGSAGVERLILESKSLSLMGKAKEHAKARKWELAFVNAIKASELIENFIPAKLLLANIQVQRGYYESAIKTLTELKNLYPLNRKIVSSLVLAYIDSLKLQEAKREIAAISQTKLANTEEYASLLGYFYYKTGNTVLAIKWLSESVNRNPLNDNDYYLLADLFLKHRKYNKSKLMISKALLLAPDNVKYVSHYGRILYELSDAETAIGYLRDFLEKHSEDPKIIGDIAIYYYRSGQVKEFNRYKKRIEQLNIKDESFYEFLIESSKIDERVDDVIKFSQMLIKIKPADLRARMILGEYLYKESKYKEAFETFSSIINRLESYPKAHYYLAKIYMAQDRQELALKEAMEEQKQNPNFEYGYIVAGEIFKLQKNYNDSIKNLEKAISLNGTSVEALTLLGEIRYRQNFLEAARELYLRALKVDESNPLIHRQLGFIYRDSGQSALAVESFQVYLDLTPGAKDHEIIKALIRRLK